MVSKSNGFKPNLNQLKYLEAFITSEHNISKVKLAQKIGITYKTVWEWETKVKGFNEWFHEEVVKAMGRGLAKVYQGMGVRASKNVHDATLYLKRFDDEYSEKQEIKHKIEFDEEYSKELKKMTDKEFEEEDKTVDREIKEDEDI